MCKPPEGVIDLAAAVHFGLGVDAIGAASSGVRGGLGYVNFDLAQGAVDLALVQVALEIRAHEQVCLFPEFPDTSLTVSPRIP